MVFRQRDKMKKLFILILVLLLPLTLNAGLNFGLTKGIKRKVKKIDKKVLEKKNEEEQEAEEKKETEEELIKGPDRGQGNNDGDQVFRSLTVSPNDHNIIYVGTESNGIFKSVDGGATWEWQRKGLKHSEGDIQYYTEIYDMAMDPTDTNRLYAATTDSVGPATGDYPSAMASVYKTTNGGETWEQKVNGIHNGSLASVALDASNPAVVYIGVKGGVPSFTGTDVDGQHFDGGILKSTDYGESWSKMTLPAPSTESEFWKIKLIDSSTIFALGLNHDDPAKAVGIIRTTDGGNTWDKINPSTNAVTHFDVASQDKDLICALEDNVYAVFKTTNGAESWEKISCPASGLVSISPHDKNVIFFCGYNNLYKSDNGLQAYSQVLNITERITDLEFSSTDPNIIYVGTDGYLVYKSVDGGDSFSLIANLRDYINSN